MGLAPSNWSVLKDSEKSEYQNIERLFSGLGTRNPFQNPHLKRVAVYCLSLCDATIGKALDESIPESPEKVLFYSAFLHEVDRGVSMRRLARAGVDLVDFVDIHPARAALIVEQLGNMPEVTRTVRHYLEWYDGSGLPDGLVAEEIPLLSRILAVADAYDSLATKGGLKRFRKSHVALEKLVSLSGRRFDPVVVGSFVEIFDKGYVDALDQCLEERKQPFYGALQTLLI